MLLGIIVFVLLLFGSTAIAGITEERHRLRTTRTTPLSSSASPSAQERSS